MKDVEVYRLAVMLERHEGVYPAISVPAAELIFDLAKVYALGGADVPLDLLIQRCREPFPWLFIQSNKNSE